MNDLSSDNRVFYHAGRSGNGIKVVIGANVKKIPDYLFQPYADASLYSSKIVSVEFEEGSVCEHIGEYAFDSCGNLTSVHITDIAAWCNISFGNDVANPLYYAGNLYLNGTLVTELFIPDSVTSIGSYAFQDCDSLTSITIPDSVTIIGEYAFWNCDSLTSITIPDSVTSIGSYAFYSCESLNRITVGNGITRIGNKAFWGCIILRNVTFTGTKAEWSAISKGVDWKYCVPASMIICSDGSVSI